MFTIVPASRADIRDTAVVLASAFSNDTVMATLVVGEAREARLTLLFSGLMRSGALKHGRIDLARRDSDGAIVGAAIWVPPGPSTSLLSELRELPTFLRALGWRGLREAIRLRTTLARHRPMEPHWYLAQIGVSAQARGAGVGSALLASRLEKVDSEHAPAYLESSNERNRALYGRHGFVTIATVGGIPDSAPAAMWRVAA
ncbi:GNAT family N-acetyltransferase [Microbacterium sp. ZW T5_45]|uniref:GNAT family N-acetyltransferase n=1 Tax=Microbacterium sp. ZW T5_45 TaxID=3378080 RepID=UPI0038542859